MTLVLRIISTNLKALITRVDVIEILNLIVSNKLNDNKD